MDIFHAKVHEQVANDLSHVLIVVDDQNLDRVHQLFNVARKDRMHAAIPKLYVPSPAGTATRFTAAI
jgi:hypothetical protein